MSNALPNAKPSAMPQTDNDEEAARSLASVLAALQNLHPKLIDLSLGRMEALLDRLGRPQDRLPPIVHVAGTNGKGSTIAFLRAMLEARGLAVHVYTSPHLVRFNERIRLGVRKSENGCGGVLAEDNALLAMIRHCLSVNDGAPITVFEFTTAVGLCLFAQHPADVLLLEVGLGGRFDATNVIAQPKLAVITSISYDHQEFLGDTLEKIAHEKAGIIKKGAPVVCAAQHREALRAIERAVLETGAAPFWQAGRDFFARAEQGRMLYEDEDGLIDLPLPKLQGAHQIGNAALALAAMKFLVPARSQASLAQGLVDAHWPARLQNLARGPLLARLPKGAELWLDGGHNGDGGRVLAEAMGQFSDNVSRPLVMICAILANKDAAAFLRPFQGLLHSLIAVPIPDTSATRDPFEICAYATALGLPCVAGPSFVAALDFIGAQFWPVAPRVLIAGSLYLAGAVLREQGDLPS